MKTLKDHVSEVYRNALDKVLSFVGEHDFIDPPRAYHEFLEGELKKFEGEYVEEVEPFTDEFVYLIFNGFREKILQAGLKAFPLSNEDEQDLGYWEIYGYDERKARDQHIKRGKRG